MTVTVIPLYAHEAEVVNLALYRELRLLRSDLPRVPPSRVKRHRRRSNTVAVACSAASVPPTLLGGGVGRDHGEPEVTA